MMWQCKFTEYSKHIIVRQNVGSRGSCVCEHKEYIETLLSVQYFCKFSHSKKQRLVTKILKRTSSCFWEQHSRDKLILEYR